MSHIREFEGASHFEAETAAHHDKRDVLQSVRVALPEFVCPNYRRVVEEATAAAGSVASRDVQENTLAIALPELTFKEGRKLTYNSHPSNDV